MSQMEDYLRSGRIAAAAQQNVLPSPQRYFDYCVSKGLREMTREDLGLPPLDWDALDRRIALARSDAPYAFWLGADA